MDDAPRSLVVRPVPSAAGPVPSDRWTAAITEALVAAVAAGLLSGWRIEGQGEPPAQPSPERLVLVLATDVLVLGSTLQRMIGALGPGAEAVSARELPIEPGAEGPGCLLLARPGGVPVPCESAVVFRDRRRDAPSSSAHALSAPAGSLLERALPEPGLAQARQAVTAQLGTSGDPLLSVVMRTQGARPEPMRDALLCLAGQADPRFELIVVVHDGDPGAARAVLDDQPDWLVERTRVLTATGGTRSVPLNVGIEAARGTHVAFLDDDDLVFAHWVGSFLDAALASPRMLLRAAVGVQRVTAEPWPDGVEGHASASAVETPYPARFDLADHLRVNMTPFMAFAFPLPFFSAFGGADESLEVCEDWDLALRAASVLGVADLPALTAIYRRWTSGSDSYTVHDSASWESAMERVRAKRDAAPLLLPPGAASELAELSAIRDTPQRLAAVYGSTSWRVTAPVRGISVALARLRRGTAGHPDS